MFKGISDTPSEKDTNFYEGVARLRVLDISTMEMEGVLLINRCWQNLKSTASVL